MQVRTRKNGTNINKDLSIFLSSGVVVGKQIVGTEGVVKIAFRRSGDFVILIDMLKVLQGRGRDN